MTVPEVWGMTEIPAPSSSDPWLDVSVLWQILSLNTRPRMKKWPFSVIVRPEEG